MANSIYWLIASGVFLLLEGFGVPGVGFLFAGLGAILTAVVISSGLIGEEAVILQFGTFAVFTAIAAALLWKKLKNWRINPNAPHYSNIVGTEAKVSGNGLSGSSIGQVSWSGTTMRARLADPSATLAAGTIVKVTAVEGTVLVVTAS